MAAPYHSESLHTMRTSRRVLRESLLRIERGLRSCATLEHKAYYLGRVREEAHKNGNGQSGYLAFCYVDPGELEVLERDGEVSPLTSAQHFCPAERISFE